MHVILAYHPYFLRLDPSLWPTYICTMNLWDEHWMDSPRDELSQQMHCQHISYWHLPPIFVFTDNIFCIPRSPGGTPLRPKQHNQDIASNDPGAIIAQALRRKFAHQVFQDSPGKHNLAQHTVWLNCHFSILDKENLNRSDASLSGFDSPNVKLVSITMLCALYMYNVTYIYVKVLKAHLP